MIDASERYKIIVLPFFVAAANLQGDMAAVGNTKFSLLNMKLPGRSYYYKVRVALFHHLTIVCVHGEGLAPLGSRVAAGNKVKGGDSA